MKTYKKIISLILLIIAIICLVIAAYFVIDGIIQDKHSANIVESLRPEPSPVTQVSATPDPTTIPTPQPTPEATATPTPEPTPTPVPAVENPYRDSFLANKDMAAWLQIPGTTVDYPVMWTPEDENYYLYRAFDGSENKNGSLILDTDSCLDPLTTNLIIHGHNMRSGAMFGNLLKYE